MVGWITNMLEILPKNGKIKTSNTSKKWNKHQIFSKENNFIQIKTTVSNPIKFIFILFKAEWQFSMEIFKT
jgi:hypothetical protein